MLAIVFRSASVLWLFAFVPVLVALYLLAQRRRARYAVRFTNLDLLASVVTRSPTWRRHIPPLVYLLALATLLLALGRPTVTASVAQQQAAVMLVVDVSGSMVATDVQPTRIAAAQNAARTFIDQVPPKLPVGLVAFSTEARLLAPPTTDHASVRIAVDRLTALGATAMGDAIDLAVQATGPLPTAKAKAKHPPAVVLLLSDGKNTVGRDPLDAATDANNDDVHVFTVALGTPDGVAAIPDNNGVVQDIPVPPDPDTLQAVAQRTGGKFFTAPTAEQLTSVYSGLGSSIGRVPKPREITAEFAGGALILMLVGGALALLWFNRFP
ncbi:MAG: Ca-activated chloride channel [Acidimicrobiaceae bacterium]|nr:Ca-activated chloride channel [Acidimicrobiaceae bacterium]